MYMCALPQRSGGRRKRPHPDFDTQSVDITFRVCMCKGIICTVLCTHTGMQTKEAWGEGNVHVSTLLGCPVCTVPVKKVRLFSSPLSA